MARTLRLRHMESKKREGRKIPLIGELWDLIQRRWNARACKGPNGVPIASCIPSPCEMRTRVRRQGVRREANQWIFEKAFKPSYEKAKLIRKLFHDLRWSFRSFGFFSLEFQNSETSSMLLRARSTRSA